MPQMFHHIGRGSLGTVHPRLAGQANADIGNLFATENNHEISSLLSSYSYYGFGSEYTWDPDPVHNLWSQLVRIQVSLNAIIPPPPKKKILDSWMFFLEI